MIKETVPKPGFYSRDYNKNDTETKKPCKKVGFSQIKRVSKEEMKMEMEFDKEEALLEIEAMYRARRRARHNPQKKIIVLRKKDQQNDKSIQICKPKPENKGSDNNK